MRAEAYTKIMLAVLDDRNRSLENAIERGIEAGIMLERDRVKSIVELPIPAGLGKAVIAMILHGATQEAVAGLLELYAEPTAPVSVAEVRRRRATFRLVEHEKKTEEK